MDRGKVMTAAELEAGKDFGRYLDVDGDGIPYRTYPGTHPTRGAFFTRGTTKNRYARYSEEGPDYVENMERLLKKFETAKTLVPEPVARPAKQPTKFGVIYFGSTTPAMDEALDALEAQGIHLDLLRVRGFPFAAGGARLHRRARPGLRRRAEPRRAAAHAADERGRARSRRSSSPCCTTTARRSPRASSPARSPSGCARST